MALIRRVVKPQRSDPLVEDAFARLAPPDLIVGFPSAATSDAEWRERMAGADVVVHFFADGAVPLATLSAAQPEHLVVAGPSAGCVDAQRASYAGIAVHGRSGLTVAAVAELTLGLMLDRARCGPERYGLQLHGATVGIIGFGAIGRAVSERCIALGMQVLVASESTPDDEVRRLGAVPTGIRELVATSDVVTVHSRAVAGAAPVIDAALIALMREGAILIDTARISLIDLASARDAVLAGRLGGLAIDARDGEIADDDPLRGCAAVRITDHRGWMTASAIDAMVSDAIARIIDVA